MSDFVVGDGAALIAAHGLWRLALVIALESIGLPLPGETVLVTAFIYAGASGQLARGRIIAATTGVLISDSVESVIEAERLVSACSCATARAWELRLARSRWAAPSSCANGGRVVVWGRFVAVPRVLATVLAGVNGMLWPRFLIFNVTGGIVWPTTFACAATLFGATAHGAAAGPGRFMALTLAAAFAILARGPGAPSRGVSHRGRGASFFKIAHARVSAGPAGGRRQTEGGLIGWTVPVEPAA